MKEKFGKTSKKFQNIMKLIVGKYLEIFSSLPGGKSTNPGRFNFVYIFPLNFLNLVLIPSEKFDGHRGTWTGCM